jgi:DNA invertase Pin-like site-specific DNA recombinase
VPHKKTVIDCRFSTDMQRADSCADQERGVRAGLARRGSDPADAVVLQDEAESGTKTARDGFQQLCDMVARGEVGGLAVDDQSRLTRGYVLNVLAWAAAYGFHDLPPGQTTILLGYLAIASFVARLAVLGALELC